MDKTRTQKWAIEPLVGLGHNALIYAQQGSGKSWLAWFMARAVSKGDPFLGKFKTTRARCIIYDEETPISDLADRTNLVFGQGRVSKAQIFNPPQGTDPDTYLAGLKAKGTRVLIFPQGSFSLGHKNPVKRLRQDITSFDADMVILDNLNAMQGNLKIERDNWAVAKVRYILRQVRVVRPNLTIIIIHHQGKLKERGPRGSSSILDMSDTSFRLQRIQDDPLQFAVVQDQRKRKVLVKPFLLELTEKEGGQLDLTYVEELPDGGVEEVTEDAVDIAEYVLLHRGASFTVKSIREETRGRFSESTIRDELKALKRNGFLEVDRLSHNQFQYRPNQSDTPRNPYLRALLKKLEDRGHTDLMAKSKAEDDLRGIRLGDLIFLKEIANRP
ncbi:MAG: AAA family ATPase [Methanothrix sp.]|nr:AAA family ATPase [Methanothrix sp.]